jgi:hypothetical protein
MRALKRNVPNRKLAGTLCNYASKVLLHVNAVQLQDR